MGSRATKEHEAAAGARAWSNRRNRTRKPREFRQAWGGDRGDDRSTVVDTRGLSEPDEPARPPIDLRLQGAGRGLVVVGARPCGLARWYDGARRWLRSRQLSRARARHRRRPLAG